MKLEKVLWKNDMLDGALLIDKKDIVEKAWVGNYTLIIDNISVDEIEHLQEQLSVIDQKLLDVYDMEEFLKRLDFENAKASSVEEFPTIENKLAFDCYTQKFFNIADVEPIKIYEWWDGNNFKTFALDENTTETELIITDDFIDLDEWDGRNFATGRIGNHERLYRILEIDGQDVSHENVFLLNRWSQWQGSHETGEIMDLDEVRRYLKEIGRDVEKYL